MYINKDLIEHKLYQSIGEFNEKNIDIDFVLLDNIH